MALIRLGRRAVQILYEVWMMNGVVTTPRTSLRKSKRAETARIWLLAGVDTCVLCEGPVGAEGLAAGVAFEWSLPGVYVEMFLEM